MKLTLIAALLTAQLAATPSLGATLAPVEASHVRTGAFAGALLRITLGGNDSGQARAGLGIGPLRTAQGADGRIRTSFGEGLEFGSRAGATPQLSFAGRSLDQIRLQADAEGDKGGVPTWAWIVGGTVLVLGVAGAVTLDYLRDQSE